MIIELATALLKASFLNSLSHLSIQSLRRLFMSRATRQLGDKGLSPERTNYIVNKTKLRQNSRETNLVYFEIYPHSF